MRGIILMAISAECPNGFLDGGGTRFHFSIQVLTINIHRDSEALVVKRRTSTARVHTQSGVNGEVSWLQLQLSALSTAGSYLFMEFLREICKVELIKQVIVAAV